MLSHSISVIIPFYNSVDTIERAIVSVFNQTLLPLEIIIVDDKSFAESKAYAMELVEKYKNKKIIDIKFFSLEQNVGAGEARNYGWSKASGDLIAFLDSDDSWLSNKLEVQSKFFYLDGDLVLCGHSYLINTDKKPIKKEYSTNKMSFKIITKREQLFRNRFATSTVMIRNNIDERFKVNKRYSEDFLLWSEIICNNHKAIHLDEILCIYFKPIFGSAGLSSNMKKMYEGNINTYYTLYKKNYIGIIEYIFYRIFSYFKYLRRIVIVFLSKSKV